MPAASPSPEPIEARRCRAAFVLTRKALQEAIKHGGPNAKLHCGDLLNVLDMFAVGQMDHTLDQDESAVTGPHHLLPPSVQ